MMSCASRYLPPCVAKSCAVCPKKLCCVSRFAGVIEELCAGDPRQCLAGQKANASSEAQSEDPRRSWETGTSSTRDQKARTVSTSWVNPGVLSLVWGVLPGLGQPGRYLYSMHAPHTKQKQEHSKSDVVLQVHEEEQYLSILSNDGNETKNKACSTATTNFKCQRNKVNNKPQTIWKFCSFVKRCSTSSMNHMNTPDSFTPPQKKDSAELWQGVPSTSTTSLISCQ